MKSRGENNIIQLIIRYAIICIQLVFLIFSYKFLFLDMHFISLRARDPLENSNEIAAQVLRMTYDEAFSDQTLKPTIEPFKWFFVAKLLTLQEKTLTLLHSKRDWVKGEAITVNPRDILSFLMTFAPIDPMDLDHNEPDDDNPEEEPADTRPAPALKGECKDECVTHNNRILDEGKKDPFMNRRVGESIENFEIGDTVHKTQKPTSTASPPRKQEEEAGNTEIQDLMKELQKVEAEKESLKNKLETEISHSKSNRLVALTFVIIGLMAIIYLRKTKNIVYVFLFALLINILVPVFLFLPESGHI
jgi:hypothetical protein